MGEFDPTPLAAALESALAPLGFVPRPIALPYVPFGWVRKTWNTNRGVALVCPAAGETPGELAQRLKLPIGKALGYFPFFYSMGLQAVIAVPQAVPPAGVLERFVDRIDNQRCVLQSLHVVDTRGFARVSARTWAQVVTGGFQDAIEQAIDAWIGAAGGRERTSGG